MGIPANKLTEKQVNLLISIDNITKLNRELENLGERLKADKLFIASADPLSELGVVATSLIELLGMINNLLFVRK